MLNFRLLTNYRKELRSYLSYSQTEDYLPLALMYMLLHLKLKKRL